MIRQIVSEIELVDTKKGKPIWFKLKSQDQWKRGNISSITNYSDREFQFKVTYDGKFETFYFPKSKSQFDFSTVDPTPKQEKSKLISKAEFLKILRDVASSLPDNDYSTVMDQAASLVHDNKLVKYALAHGITTKRKFIEFIGNHLETMI